MSNHVPLLACSHKIFHPNGQRRVRVPPILSGRGFKDAVSGLLDYIDAVSFDSFKSRFLLRNASLLQVYVPIAKEVKQEFVMANGNSK